MSTGGQAGGQAGGSTPSALERVVDLPSLYADLILGGDAARDTSWLALCMVSSVDGSVTLGDVSGGLGGPADRRALARIRDACDVILVGAGTVRDEDYPPYPGGRDRQAQRMTKGLAARPPVAMVTRSGELPDGHPLVADPERAPIVIVPGDTADTALARLARTPAGDAIVPIVSGSAEIDWPHALASLAAMGLRRVSCEGGPTLNAALLAADAVDEVFLTLAPALVAGDGPRLSHGPTGAHRRELRLVSVLEHEGELLLRYQRA
jgi:5-amino-6-(5-phosphoribosylamino)uracil reductase